MQLQNNGDKWDIKDVLHLIIKLLKVEKESCRFCTSRGSFFFFQFGLGSVLHFPAPTGELSISGDIYSLHTPHLCYIKTAKFAQGRPHHPSTPSEKPHVNISNRNVFDGD